MLGFLGDLGTDRLPARAGQGLDRFISKLNTSSQRCKDSPASNLPPSAAQETSKDATCLSAAASALSQTALQLGPDRSAPLRRVVA